MTTKMPATHSCLTCGEMFRPRPSQLRKGEGKYCKLACRPQSHRGPKRTPREALDEGTARGPDCWLWTGLVSSKGYGKVTVGAAVYAHRLAYELAHGPIPAGMFVCHRCDNPRCVKPAHLFLGTLEDNVADMVAKGRQARGSRNHIAKLTEPLVAELRKRHAAGGVTYAGLAKTLGLDPETVRTAVTRRSWKHVA